MGSRIRSRDKKKKVRHGLWGKIYGVELLFSGVRWWGRKKYISSSGFRRMIQRRWVSSPGPRCRVCGSGVKWKGRKS